MAFNKNLKEILYSVAAIISALLLGALLIKLSGHSALKAYYYLFYGAFGSTYNIAQTFLKTIPLIFTGLAVAVGFQSGLFNIGAEGQLYLGAFAAALAAIIFSNLPGFILIPLALAAGALAGSLWAAVPGILRAKTGAHEVITTIMFNYIGILLTTFLLKNYFKEEGPVDQTKKIAEQARLPELVANTRLTWALFIAIFVIIIIYYLLNHTAYGYDLQLVGENINAAEYSGVDSDKVIINTMLLSGGIAGLAGSTMVLGVLHRFITNFSPGYGFTGIAVAVLGRNKPLGVLFAAFLFGILESGGMSMQLFAKIPADLMTIVQGLVILFVAAPSIFKILKNKSGIFRGDNS
ncbi:nucleoside ABC transporter membrane protein [Halanaerobium saccharolyticum]|uniref:Nucleoside ABC transporter membrane protein n=1 Tax=Halanaerobium saccharolyticum TaxID=43595 RepID=A0A4R6M1G2_9FIRM|nr:ABC transporter permease [Halanaerobium saccharolyticum]TDO95067.1 nucleoside ABC transporter membrane protein [Halanaerobium saccharolyticum]